MISSSILVTSSHPIASHMPYLIHRRIDSAVCPSSTATEQQIQVLLEAQVHTPLFSWLWVISYHPPCLSLPVFNFNFLHPIHLCSNSMEQRTSEELQVQREQLEEGGKLILLMALGDWPYPVRYAALIWYLTSHILHIQSILHYVYKPHSCPLSLYLSHFSTF